MTLVETILVFAVIPAALYAVIALLTLRERFAKTPRYRPGQDWEHPAVWWTANPAGLDAGHAVVTAPAADTAPRRTAKGGARGSW
ncbi:aa3-type cytochrome oxidase subunit CtaJ [Actinokineospora sp. HUAS TT18]|uniref:aa3-type cytochrome oxidase subunit CtaJ n=1 Tax=Actinokineospora sp. HUAS TT18 TaxID=3447451 RepID=UPI003F5205CF